MRATHAIATLLLFSVSAQAAQPPACMPTYDAGETEMRRQAEDAREVLHRRDIRGYVGFGVGAAGGCAAGYKAGDKLTPHDEGAVGFLLCSVALLAVGALGGYVGDHFATKRTKERERAAPGVLRSLRELVIAKGVLAASDLLINHKDEATPEQLKIAIEALQGFEYYVNLSLTLTEIATRVVEGDASGAICAQGHPMGATELGAWILKL